MKRPEIEDKIKALAYNITDQSGNELVVLDKSDVLDLIAAIDLESLQRTKEPTDEDAWRYSTNNVTLTKEEDEIPNKLFCKKNGFIEGFKYCKNTYGPQSINKELLREKVIDFRNMYCQNVDIDTIDEFLNQQNNS